MNNWPHVCNTFKKIHALNKYEWKRKNILKSSKTTCFPFFIIKKEREILDILNWDKKLGPYLYLDSIDGATKQIFSKSVNLKASFKFQINNILHA